jgi:formylglycine-generating enzyme required for sulfatase activity
MRENCISLVLVTTGYELFYTRMRTPRLNLSAALFVALFVTSRSFAQSPLVNIETVLIGDAGNVADTRTNRGTLGYGGVGYEYRLGKYEVTVAQYTAFLNSAAPTDPYGLYNTAMGSNLNIAGISRSNSSGSFAYNVIEASGNRPIAYVSWFDAARFANWMHNGATNGASTETGAYTLNGATNGIILKNPDAIWWIPSADEWFKAAYYKAGGTNAGYWLYPTQSDAQPGNQVGNATNQSNYRSNNTYSVTQSTNYSSTQAYLTEVGAFESSPSAYQTFDQGGNLGEWNDDVIQDSFRSVRGLGWGFDAASQQATTRSMIAPHQEGMDYGFRLATVPEPSTYMLLLMSAGGALWLASRRR